MKKVDNNGFWKIKDNPITKEGVFQYLGKTISKDLEADKLYNVYRPFTELSKKETIESFNNVPFLNGHEMIGEKFTPYDKRTAGGVLNNIHPDTSKKIIFGDITVFSESMKNDIKNGKKELSLGYCCDYEKSGGEFNGQAYDFVQKNIRGNHIALVNNGRMGSDVRVYDSKYTYDSIDTETEIQSKKEDNELKVNKDEPSKDEFIDKPKFSKIINQMEGEGKISKELKDELLSKLQGAIYKRNTEDEQMSEEEKKKLELEKGKKAEDEKVDKRKLIDEIGGILKDKVDNEIIRTVLKKAEELSYNDSEKSADDEDDKDKDKKGEDKSCGDGKSKDEDPKKDDDKKEDGKAMDEADIVKKVLAQMEAKKHLIEMLTPHIGAFACDGLTDDEVAIYGCKKLNVTVSTGAEAKAYLNGYLANKKSSSAMDAAPVAKKSGASDFISNYLKSK